MPRARVLSRAPANHVNDPADAFRDQTAAHSVHGCAAADPADRRGLRARGIRCPVFGPHSPGPPRPYGSLRAPPPEPPPGPAPPRRGEPGCAHVVGQGYGWADIWNECGYTVFATVEVDGFDPPCIQTGPGATARTGLEPGDEPYHGYEC